nr:uncharacterized protein LOC128700999 isoform X1 [Cherax quadricarinatus]
MILQMIIIFIKVLSITASEVNCDSPLRGKETFFNVPSENNFCLWYKMDEKYTQLNFTYRTNVWDSELPPVINYSGVRSNTEEYISITSDDILTQLKETSQNIRQINSVTITGNATMEWIKCKNCQSFPAITNIATVAPLATYQFTPGTTNNIATVVLLVVVVVLMVTLAVTTVYIRHLKKKSSQSGSLSQGEAVPMSTVGQEEHIYEEWTGGQLRPPSPTYITVYNSYDDTMNTTEQERPSDWISPQIQDGLSHDIDKTTAQQMQPSGRSSNHDIENDST